MLYVPKRTLQGWRYRRIGPPYARLQPVHRPRHHRDRRGRSCMRAQAV